MVATPLLVATLVCVPLTLLPRIQGPAPTADCRLDVLTPFALEERTLAQFNASLDYYVTLHRRLERSLPPEQIFDDPEDMFGASEALASAIRDARPNVRQGNIFTPGVASVLRARLDGAVRRHNRESDLLAAIGNDWLPGMPEPEVNKPLPWGVGIAVWPTLVRALPELPRELEYRFAGRTLVLLDFHANMVVDILDDALPAN